MKQKKFRKAFRQMTAANRERAARKDLRAYIPRLGGSKTKSVSFDPLSVSVFLDTLVNDCRQSKVIRRLLVDVKWLLDTNLLSNHGK